jgi:hypothetical protein
MDQLLATLSRTPLLSLSLGLGTRHLGNPLHLDTYLLSRKRWSRNSSSLHERFLQQLRPLQSAGVIVPDLDANPTAPAAPGHQGGLTKTMKTISACFRTPKRNTRLAASHLIASAVG